MNPETLHTYLIEPKAPLSIRSGRSFDEVFGADAARFPPPSTLAGALRSAHARNTDKALGPALNELAIAGPLPVMMNESNHVTILVPKPLDAHYYADQQQLSLIRAEPKALSANEGCDLPEGLWPLQFTQTMNGKPAKGPQWWSFDDLIVWRKNLASAPLSINNVLTNGWTPPEDDIRTHVKIDSRTGAAEHGKLFQTVGLCMWQKTEGRFHLPHKSIGILGGIDGEIRTGILNLGGAGRMASVTPKTGLWPTPPEKFAESIIAAKAMTLTLLTPALFDNGWLPGWLDPQTFEGTPPGCEQLKIKLVAAAVDRWQPRLGWDLHAKKSRATRRMAPAGSTYWFNVIEANHTDLNHIWLNHLSDQQQDRLDGFGLALPHAFHLNES